MLDPLSALSLGSNVLQVLQFTSELIKHSQEVRNQGSLTSINQLRLTTQRAISQAESIRVQIITAVPTAADLIALPPYDQRLLETVVDYQNTGSELLQYLDRLFPLISGKPSLLQGFERTAKAALKRETLEYYDKRLASLQDALKLEVTTALRAELRQEQQRTDGQFDIISNSLQTLIQQLEHSPILDEQRLRAIIDGCLSQHFHNYALQQPNTFPIPQYHDTNRNTQKEKSILRMLYFRQMQDRRQEVAEACSETLEWIFRPPAGYCPWSSFVKFLEMEQSLPYWINGKAGSGKSTLTKFILKHKQTYKILSRWAGQTELMVVSFFLWNQGTPLQKSHVGLLRSILHTILEKHPDWIADTFPVVWDNWKVTDEEEPPSLIEVQQGFKRLLAKRATKICIVIDGVDEFDGDHVVLASYLKGLCGPDTKVVLSSRPIPDSVAAFGPCPQLRLQDLTINDIRIFVKNHLVENLQVKELLRSHPAEANQLIKELQEMADGVFLWVHLVVKLLIEGLQKEEQIADLQRRLRAMPPTLELLYTRMMDNMDNVHRVKAAETFKVVESWNAQAMQRSFSALLLSATEIDDSSPKGPLVMEAVKDRCLKVEAFIRNRCCGLLEVHRRYNPNSDHARTEHAGLIQDFARMKLDDVAITDASVQYLHRTVAEFLHTNEIWSKICDLTAESFDPESRLSQACYFMIQHQPNTNRATGEVWNWVNNYAIFARGISKISDTAYLRQMRLLDETMTEFHRTTQNDNLHWSSHWPLATMKKFGDAEIENGLMTGHSFMTFAVRMGFYRYLELQLNIDDYRIPYELYALDSWFDRGFIPPLHVRSNTIRFLLRGNRANSRIGRHSSWQLALHLIDTSMDSNFVLDGCKLLELYILAGAAVNDAYAGTSASDLVRRKLRNYRKHQMTEDEKCSDYLIGENEKRPGSEYVVLDESQIQQYAQKLEMLLYERGASDQWKNPTQWTSQGTTSLLTPSYPPTSPPATPAYGGGWSHHIEGRALQLSFSPPNAQHLAPTFAFSFAGQNSSHCYAYARQHSYPPQTYGQSSISTPQLSTQYGQFSPLQNFSGNIHWTTPRHGHWPSTYVPHSSPYGFPAQYRNGFN